MAREEIEIEISPNGKVTVRTKGIKGQACLDIAETFVQLLGREEEKQLTSEYYESSTEAQTHQQVHHKRNG